MNAAAPTTDSDAAIMSHYGITCVSVPQYHYKSWHYAKLSDAVAQAKRDGVSSAG
jgi:hypothetical protein